MQHPTVAECCVLGLTDNDYGEAVTAIIIAESAAKKRREDESKPVITLEELCGWAKDKLAPYKVLKICQSVVKTRNSLVKLFFFFFLVHNILSFQLPTRLLIWESLPRNAMGKVAIFLSNFFFFLE